MSRPSKRVRALSKKVDRVVLLRNFKNLICAVIRA